MRIEATATSMSWIPSESVWSGMRRGFEMGLAHWDEPLPDAITGTDEVHELCRAGPVPLRQRAHGVGRGRGRQDHVGRASTTTRGW